jgi:hypothetical protein
MLVEDMIRMCEERGVPLRLDEDGALVIPPEASERLSGLNYNIFQRHARRSIPRMLLRDDALRRRAARFDHGFTSYSQESDRPNATQEGQDDRTPEPPHSGARNVRNEYFRYRGKNRDERAARETPSTGPRSRCDKGRGRGGGDAAGTPPIPHRGPFDCSA